MDLILRCVYLCIYTYILIIYSEIKKHEYYQEYSQICHVESLCMFSYQGGDTALTAASAKGHLEVASLLVSRGADMNIQQKVSTRIGCVYKQIRMNMYITKNSYIINEYNICYM